MGIQCTGMVKLVVRARNEYERRQRKKAEGPLDGEHRSPRYALRITLFREAEMVRARDGRLRPSGGREAIEGGAGILQAKMETEYAHVLRA